MAPPLAFESVEKAFADGTKALAGVDFRLRAGEFLAVLGPSGCGKSTLMRLAAGLLQPSAGQVKRSGLPAGPGGVGCVFQDPTLMPWADVRANVRLPLTLMKRADAEAAAKVETALALVGLDAFTHAYPARLSGGMRMRVAIARALVTEPALLLLDEPFAALDEITRFRLNDDLLALWQARGFSVLFVTHSVGEAVYLAGRILVMTRRPGRIAAEIPVSLPTPRTAAMRASPAFATLSGAVSRALAEATEG